MICRIQTRVPIPLEKHDFLPQMGRFTLRDEGKTIAIGKVLKYKPVKVNQFAATQQTTQATTQNPGTDAGKEEIKQSTINTTTAQGTNQIE